MSDECSFAREELEKTLEDLNNAWNILCERLDMNRQTLQQAKELEDFYTSLELISKKIDDIKRSVESSYKVNDPRSVKNNLQNQEVWDL